MQLSHLWIVGEHKRGSKRQGTDGASYPACIQPAEELAIGIEGTAPISRVAAGEALHCITSCKGQHS